MISFILSIPYFIIVFAIIYNAFAQKEEIEEMFQLRSKIVLNVLYPVVLVSLILWVVNLFLPIALVVGIFNLIINIVCIIWFLQCLSKGYVKLWWLELKNKFKK